MEVFNNLGVVIQSDRAGNIIKERLTGCKIEESLETGAYFVTKRLLGPGGEIIERKFLLPEDMSPEEYLQYERQTEEYGLALLLAIKAEIRATCNSVSEIIARARDAFTNNKRVYAAAVSAGGWDKTKFSAFCAISEEEYAAQKRFCDRDVLARVS